MTTISRRMADLFFVVSGVIIMGFGGYLVMVSTVDSLYDAVLGALVLFTGIVISSVRVR